FMAQRMKARRRAHPIDPTPIVTAPSAVVDIIARRLPTSSRAERGRPAPYGGSDDRTPKTRRSAFKSCGSPNRCARDRGEALGPDLRCERDADRLGVDEPALQARVRR